MINLKSIGGTNSRINNGTFIIEDQIVAGRTDYTFEIDLDRDDYIQGFLNLHMPGDVIDSKIRRLGSFIQFTTALNDAVSKTTDRLTYNVYGYNFDSWHFKGYWYEQDSQLSEAEFRDHFGYVGTMYIKSCRIDGDKIKIVFYNVSTYNAYLTVEGGFQVFR